MKEIKNTFTNSITTSYVLTYKIVGLVFIFSFLIACNGPKVEEQLLSNEKIYFDLTGLVQKDIDSNTIKNCGENKFALIDGIKEDRKIDTVDWSKELKPVLDCDINKSSWKDNFLVDTFKNEITDLTTISYRSLSDRINVKSFIVDYDSTKIHKIRIVKKINSLIFSSVQIIDYVPGEGFNIREEQKAIMMKSFEILVNVKYNCK